MKKILLLALLVASTAAAQGRPPKVLCPAVTVDEEGVPIEPCLVIDSDDNHELKVLFNEIATELRQLLQYQRDYNNGNANKHRSDNAAAKAQLEALRDSLTDPELKAKYQKKIDNLDESLVRYENEKLEREAPGPEIAALNQQLNELDARIN